MKRITIGEFIHQVPQWRDKYIHDNGCALKVEALIQRKTDDPVLQMDVCNTKNMKRWDVEGLIQQRLKEIQDAPDREWLNKADIEIVVKWGGNPHGMWGGDPRSLRGRIPKNNSDEEIRHHTVKATKALQSNQLVAALTQVTNIYGVGDSFGTKILAMRAPWNAPIWDSRARGCLSEFRIGGRQVETYEQFISFCEHIAHELKSHGTPLPHGCDGSPRGTEDGRWWLRDVEMAIF